MTSYSTTAPHSPGSFPTIYIEMTCQQWYYRTGDGWIGRHLDLKGASSRAARGICSLQIHQFDSSRKERTTYGIPVARNDLHTISSSTTRRVAVAIVGSHPRSIVGNHTETLAPHGSNLNIRGTLDCGRLLVENLDWRIEAAVIKNGMWFL
jgi:hypothetical protein